MERYFNTEGPVVAEEHYHVPPLDRIDRDEVLDLIERRKYFVLHAPRQTGKTSTLLALRDLLNSREVGDYRCVYANIEAAGPCGEDIDQAIPTVLDQIAIEAQSSLQDDRPGKIRTEVLEEFRATSALLATLTRWAEADPRPLVLLIDEIDAVVGRSLLSILRQLRAGYPKRPTGFPQSVVLCGVQDVRDYRMESGPGGGKSPSAFNIKAKSLRLGDFTNREMRALLAQHTAETGQAFEPEAVEVVWKQTEGQPWLVNALCREACFESEVGRDRKHAITGADMVVARETLIRRRDTHLDQIAARLYDERVSRVVSPLLFGTGTGYAASEEDGWYVRDLGLIKLPDEGESEGEVRIANPIYEEIVPRVLAHPIWRALNQASGAKSPSWFVNGEDRSLNMAGLMRDWQQLYRATSERWTKWLATWPEAVPQIMLLASLRWVVNSEGDVAMEAAAGSGRTDLTVRWPRRRAEAPDAADDLFVIELKKLRANRDKTIRKGVKQVARYMDALGAKEGHLVLIDVRKKARTWSEKVFEKEEAALDGTPVTVWGM